MLMKRFVGYNVATLAAATPDSAAGPVRNGGFTRPTPIRPVHAANCVMASPRACLMGAPIRNVAEHSSATGAAENLARADGARDRAVNPTDGFTIPKGATTETGGFEEVVPCSWTAPGTDGAREVRGGPGVGYTNIGIPARFGKSGTCCVRGIVSACARSWNPRPLGLSHDQSAKEADIPKDWPPAPLALDRDVAHVTVRVVDWPIPDAQPQEEVAVHPDGTYTLPTPNVADPDALSPDEDDLSDSGVFDFVDPGVFVRARGQDAQVLFVAYWQLEN